MIWDRDRGVVRDIIPLGDVRQVVLRLPRWLRATVRRDGKGRLVVEVE